MDRLKKSCVLLVIRAIYAVMAFSLVFLIDFKYITFMSIVPRYLLTIVFYAFAVEIVFLNYYLFEDKILKKYTALFTIDNEEF